MRPPTEERLVITGCASCGQAWKVGAAFRSCRLTRDKACATIHRRAGWDKNSAIEKAAMNCGDNIQQDATGIYDLLGILNKLLIAGSAGRGLRAFAAFGSMALNWIAPIVFKSGV